MRREWLSAVLSFSLLFVYIINLEAFKIHTSSKVIYRDQLDWMIT